MSDERLFPGPSPVQADTLNAWRELFESKHSADFAQLKGTDCLEEPIFTFEVDYRDIDQNDLLGLGQLVAAWALLHKRVPAATHDKPALLELVRSVCHILGHLEGLRVDE